MNASEIRSSIAFTQAELQILHDHARALDEIEAAGAIDTASDWLGKAFKRLEGAVTIGGQPRSAEFGRRGEVR